MPHLTVPISVNGPIIDVLIGVSAPRQTALQNASQPIPAAMPARVLVDTGASHSVIDPGINTQLRLAPTGVIFAHTPSTAGIPHQMQQYDVSLYIQHKSGLTRYFSALAISASHLKMQGIDGLLGRDVLSECLFIYSGPDQTFFLSI